MAYKFKKQIFGFMDLLRFKKMVVKRKEMLESAPATPIPATYRVNETAKILHPGNQDAKLIEIIEETSDTKTYVFELTRKMFFRAGQYVTVRTRIGESLVSRPYAISSSPYTALNEGKLSVTIKKAGFFSEWMYNNAKVGDMFVIGDPSGEFYYEPLKDRRNILAIAGGSGITPFYSMAQALKEGSEDFNLTLIYGAKTEQDIILRKEIEALKSNKFKVVYVLSNEEKEGYEHGFISLDIIKKYAPQEFTIMMCGPQAMYSFVDKEIAPLNLETKFIKHEANCVGRRDVAPKTYNLTVHIRDEVYNIKASAEETLLVSMERAGLTVPSKCRAGGCGFCHSKLVNGKFTVLGADKRRLADAKFGYIHPCCSYPDSDIELIVPKG